MLQSLNVLRRELVKDIVYKQRPSISDIRKISKVSKIIASCTNAPQLSVAEKVLEQYNTHNPNNVVIHLNILKDSVERRVAI